MNKTWLSYLLLLLIVIQSVASVADVHSILQPSTQHQTPDSTDGSTHDHASSDAVTLATDLQEKDAAPDCSHCCHCHGASVSALVKVSSWVFNSTKASLQSRYQNHTSHGAITGLFRPPRF